MQTSDEDLAKVIGERLGLGGTRDMDSAPHPQYTRCRVEHCQKTDFLPFKCHGGCEECFCEEHRKQEQHNCPAPPVREARSQPCLTCGGTVTARGETMDAALVRHTAGGTCKANQKRKAAACKCRATRCKQTIGDVHVGFACRGCGQTYCLRHRHEGDHNCAAIVVARAAARVKGVAAVKAAA